MSDEPNDQREALHEAQQYGAPSGVRIIRRGSLPEDTLHRGTCRRCGTEIEFQRRAARATSDQRDGDFLSIACPVCGDTITSTLSPRGTR